MDKKKADNTKTKNPVLAAIISAIFPGAGFFYVGNFLKGVAYMIIFGILIALEVHASYLSSSELETIVFGFLIAGFYIFQIIDSFNEARVTSLSHSEESKTKTKEEISLAGSIIILILGILFLLINLDILSYGQVIRLWPLILIGFGLKYVLNYFSLKRKEDGNE